MYLGLWCCSMQKSCTRHDRYIDVIVISERFLGIALYMKEENDEKIKLFHFNED